MRATTPSYLFCFVFLNLTASSVNLWSHCLRLMSQDMLLLEEF